MSTFYGKSAGHDYNQLHELVSKNLLENGYKFIGFGKRNIGKGDIEREVLSFAVLESENEYQTSSDPTVS